jgi:hypothetical protein
VEPRGGNHLRLEVAHAVGDALNVSNVGLAGLIDLTSVVLGGKAASDGHQLGVHLSCPGRC